jgi:hypothetical protein
MANNRIIPDYRINAGHHRITTDDNRIFPDDNRTNSEHNQRVTTNHLHQSIAPTQTSVMEEKE